MNRILINVETTSEKKNELCMESLNALKIPIDYSVEFNIVPCGMTAHDRNNLQKKYPVDYYIYITDSVVILDENIITKIVDVLDYQSIGAVGILGAQSMSVDGLYYNSEYKKGCVLNVINNGFDNPLLINDVAVDDKSIIDVRVLHPEFIAFKGNKLWNEEFSESTLDVSIMCRELTTNELRVVVMFEKNPQILLNNSSIATHVSNDLKNEFQNKYAGIYNNANIKFHNKCCELPYHIGENVRFIDTHKFFNPIGISVGANSTFHKDAWLMLPFDNFKGEPRIKIGRDCEIGHRCHISSANCIQIDDEVLMASEIHISDHNHEYKNIGVPIRRQGIDSFKNRVHIGYGSWISNNVVIAGNIYIGNGCVIAANTVLTGNRSIPDYCVVAGVPGRVVKAYDSISNSWIKVRDEEHLHDILNKRGNIDKIKKINLFRKKLNDYYESVRTNISKLINQNEYEQALVMISNVADLMYKSNQHYVDYVLEKYLIDILNKIKQNKQGYCTRKKILFFDGFGLDTRGLAQIYIKSLSKLGHEIIYVTPSSAKNNIPILECELKKSVGSYKIYYVPMVSYIEKFRYISDIFSNECPEYAFLYITPNDVSAIMAFEAMKGKVKRYQINLTDHAFILGMHAFDYCLEFRNFGATLSNKYRQIAYDKLLMAPYYPILNKEQAFTGYPFKKEKGDFVIFSGGFLYKTFDENNTYYNIVDYILSNFKHVKFWYAGFGDHSELDKLIAKYPNRVFYTLERKDLYNLLCNVDLYLNTIPLIGGLMTQFAAVANKLPLTLSFNGMDNPLDGLLMNVDKLNIVAHNVDDFKEMITRFIMDDEYRKSKERNLQNSVILEKDFDDNLKKIIFQDKSNYPIEMYDISKTIEYDKMKFIKDFIKICKIKNV